MHLSRRACARRRNSITGCTSGSKRGRQESEILMSEARSGASVKRVAREDAAAISALAREIWYAHYAAIISEAQIEYMLAQRYDPEIIRAELARGDVWGDKLLVEGRMAGFASCFLTGNAGEMKLDKLYVHHDHQRKGGGGMLLDRV